MLDKDLHKGKSSSNQVRFILRSFVSIAFSTLGSYRSKGAKHFKYVMCIFQLEERLTQLLLTQSGQFLGKSCPQQWMKLQLDPQMRSHTRCSQNKAKYHMGSLRMFSALVSPWQTEQRGQEGSAMARTQRYECGVWGSALPLCESQAIPLTSPCLILA